ncbi:serine O-acetyltransferase [Parasediminibacterium sp. JCM 36343]|uniref:serine O-acetyltransferase n=1 Tax=Parasediminibacterium sp. JCM 36343 TaxID=3374279 RepID=UPI003979E8F1
MSLTQKKSYNIFQDWPANKSNIKARLILIAFRLAHIATINRVLFIILIPYLIMYRVLVEWFLGTELPYKTIVGKGLAIHHGQATVINDGTIIGDNCIIRHCTTMGSKMLKDGTYSKSPVIGNNVDIGSNVCIIGPIYIGDFVKIGAGSVVIKDVPAGSVVVGNPGKIIG